MSEDWKLDGDESIYQAVFNLVNHMDKMSVEKEIASIIKSSVLLRYKCSFMLFLTL